MYDTNLRQVAGFADSECIRPLLGGELSVQCSKCQQYCNPEKDHDCPEGDPEDDCLESLEDSDELVF